MSRWIAIAAMAANRVIGRNGDLPWRLPEDLRWFKRTTLGHTLVMGRKTFESIGRPLPGRRTLVLSRTLSPADDITCVRSLREAEAAAEPGKDVFVVGGAEIYRLAFPRCDEIYITHVDGEYAGDTWLPPFEADFERLETLLHGEGFTIVRYVRRSPEGAIQGP